MAFTQLQARDRYILDSVSLFLNRNVKIGYDTEAGLTAGSSEVYTSPLKIVRGGPSDPDIALHTPTIAIQRIESTRKDSEYELGSAVRWRFRNYVLYCYPALAGDRYPSVNAADLLTSYMVDAFGGESMSVVDYSNPACNAQNILFCQDVMSITNVTDPMPRGSADSLNVERYRFDMHISVKFAVIESLLT